VSVLVGVLDWCHSKQIDQCFEYSPARLASLGWRRLQIKNDDGHEWQSGEILHPKKPHCIRAEQLTIVGHMIRKQSSGILVLCAAAAAVILTSCAGNQTVAQPATHKMIGTNSPGY